MEYKPEQCKIMDELGRRQELKEGLCEKCKGTAYEYDDGKSRYVCVDCLGQKVVLSKTEYNLIKKLSGKAEHENYAHSDISILDQEFLFHEV